MRTLPQKCLPRHVFRLKYNDKKKMNRHAIRLSRGSDLVSKLHQLDREWKTLTRSDTPLVHTTENAMAILKKTAPQITGWSLRVATTDVNEPLVQYYPSSGVLEMQDAVFGLFREEDMVVVAVHARERAPRARRLRVRVVLVLTVVRDACQRSVRSTRCATMRYPVPCNCA